MISQVWMLAAFGTLAIAAASAILLVPVRRVGEQRRLVADVLGEVLRGDRLCVDRGDVSRRCGAYGELRG